MLLRPRQRDFVERCTSALDEHRNTVGIAATGFGKTIALSAAVGEQMKKGARKALILQHRDELLRQNSSKFLKVVPSRRPSVFNAERKDWGGEVVFASEPTLRREANLDGMPAFDLAVIDECHHVAAPGYQRIMSRLRELSPDCQLFGVTATIARGDKQSLQPTFTNVADKVGIKELVASGHLVRPRVFAVDVGVREELAGVKKIAGEYDQDRVAEIFSVVMDDVIENWRERAGDRKTMAFCSSVKHAEETAEAFRAAGVDADVIHGELDKGERRRRLSAFEQGRTQVLTNVAVLTEGYDHPPVSCIVYLKLSSYKSTFIQAVGRALRTIDSSLFPGVIKEDAIILDFGITARNIGTLELDGELDGDLSDRWSLGEAPTKECHHCGAINPLSAKECCECGEPFEGAEPGEVQVVRDFVMTELDLLNRSPFRWIDPFGDDACMVCSGFEAWAGAFWWAGHWHAIGCRGQGRAKEFHHLGVGTKMMALALGDDWMNEHETEDASRKGKRWMTMPASEAQLKWLPAEFQGASKYHASCIMNVTFGKGQIKRLVMSRPVAMAA